MSRESLAAKRNAVHKALARIHELMLAEQVNTSAWTRLDIINRRLAIKAATLAYNEDTQVSGALNAAYGAIDLAERKFSVVRMELNGEQFVVYEGVNAAFAEKQAQIKQEKYPAAKITITTEER